MSYNNFIEKIWAKGIQTELERLHVFADGVNREYEGTIKNLGDTVRIKNVGKPTITRGNLADVKRSIVLGDPEDVPDGAVSVVVDQYSTFNYKVEDIDKAQGAGDVMDALNKETSEGLADEHDKFIANLVLGDAGVQMYNGGTPITLTKDNVFEILDLAQQSLWENDVNPTTGLTTIVPPWVHTMLRQGYIKTDTDNSQMLQNGMVAKYGNIGIKMSNNVATKKVSNADVWYIQMRTDRAIAFVNQATHLEPYRPEKGFSDAMKGLDLFGGKIVRPKEIITIPVKKA